MRTPGQLQIAAGFASSGGRRAENQDFGGVDLGSASERSLQGIVAVVADGAGQGGRTASELAVRTFLEGYRAQSGLAGVSSAAMKTLEAYNRWLNAEARAASQMAGTATTFTAAVLRGANLTVLHVGDSRAWHLRSETLSLLTEDHVTLEPNGGTRLLRALGLEPSLRLDIKTQRIEVHDRLLLATDGLHGALSSRAIHRLLGRRQSPQADADALVLAAIEAGGYDNVTAIVLDIIEVPPPEHDAITAEFEALPVGAPPQAGDSIDGFQLVRKIGEGPAACLFLATDPGGEVVLKFPKFDTASDDDRRRFVREVFVGQRITHSHIGGAISLAEGRQTRLYVAMPYYRGQTLEARLRAGPLPIEAVMAITGKVGRGLAALHRAGVVHRDVKPENIMLLEDGGLKLIDLGVARISQFDAFAEMETPGTIDFMAPELFDGERGDGQSDQYALGVTLYRMVTGRYPLGESVPDTRPIFGDVPPLTRYRPETPAWLNGLVMRAISFRKADRFGDMDELVYELEHGRAHAAPVVLARPVSARNAEAFWRFACAILAVLLIISLLTR